MASHFPNTLRGLGSDRTVASSISVAALIILALLWGLWLALANVPILLTSDQGRLEAVESGHALESALDGQVVAVEASVGQWLRRGQVVVRLDATVDLGRLRQSRGHSAARSARLDRLRAQASKHRAERVHATREGRWAIAEAQARLDALEAELTLARLHEKQQERLAAEGVVSTFDVRTAATEAASLANRVSALRAEISTLEASRAGTLDRLDAELELVTGEIESSEAELVALEAEVDQVEAETARLRIVAPVDGRLVELARLTPGRVVERGERLGVVLPDAEVEILAEFPASALGRIRPGQPASMRLDGFAWTEFGRLKAVVREVAGETHDGRVRARLAIEQALEGVPLQHGLPGIVEVEIDRTSPWHLLLRTLGHGVDRGRRAEASLAEATGP